MAKENNKRYFLNYMLIRDSLLMNKILIFSKMLIEKKYYTN